MNYERSLRGAGTQKRCQRRRSKKAYRRLSRKYHPDANINNPHKDEAEEKFKEIQQAYKSIVSGEADRASYGGAGGYGTGSSRGLRRRLWIWRFIWSVWWKFLRRFVRRLRTV
ncbi:MAG: DnaJ domain-containing protein [Coprococcus sp.]